MLEEKCRLRDNKGNEHIVYGYDSDVSLNQRNKEELDRIVGLFPEWYEEGKEYPKISLDLSKVRAFDSTAVNSLLILNKRERRYWDPEIGFSIVSPSSLVTNVIKVLNLQNVFSVYTTLEDYKKKFNIHSVDGSS